MASLVDPLLKAQSGEFSITYLRELYDAERVQMAEANEAASKPEGWMAAKDLLAGDTATDKMADYAARIKALGDAQTLIRRNQELLAAAIPELPLAGQPANQKQFAAAPSQPLTVQNLSPWELHYKGMENAPDYQAFAALSVTERAAAVDKGRLHLAATRTKDYIPALKAIEFGSNTGGVLPTDRMGMPYPLLVDELDYFVMVTEPGSIIRYFPSRTPIAPGSATGDARGRARLAAINRIDDDATVQTADKHSIGAMALVAKEDLRDHGRISERVNMQLDIAVKDLLTLMIMDGNDTAPEWKGILGQLTSSVADITAIDQLTTNSVPVHASNGTKEPIAFFESLMAVLALRGCFPTVVFLDYLTWGKVRQSQRILRNQSTDYDMSPYGRIANAIPMCLSRHLPDDTALIMDTRKTMQVVLGEQIMTGISEDFGFDLNAVAIRRTVDGNLALMMPYGLIKVTATNLFESAT